jgi:hypothetical protein
MSNNPTIATAEKVTSKHKYIFPNFMAKMMANVDPKTQYESAMLSSFLILIGIIATSIMMVFFMDLSITYKILICLNCLGGFLYISSSLVTVYQQYANYMDIMEIQKNMMAEENPTIKSNNPSQPKLKVKKKYNRLNQAMVGVGLLLIIGAIACIFTGIDLYISVGAIVVGIALILFVIKKGRDELKKKAKIEQLIREGKIIPKIASTAIVPTRTVGVARPVSQSGSPSRLLRPVTTNRPIAAPVKKPAVSLTGRIRGLMAGIKIAKLKKQQEQEQALRQKLQLTLDEIKRLKLTERRS